MTPTLLESQERLFLLLDSQPLDDVDAVYPFEPGGETTGPCFVSVALDRLRATEQSWAVRIYSNTDDSLEDATTRLYSALDAVDARLGTAALAPSEWDVGHDDRVKALVARAFIDIPRETFSSKGAASVQRVR